MSRQKIIDDGLNKWQRYRLNHLEEYRERKKEYAKTPEQRKKRAEYMQKWREKNREKHNECSRKSQKRNRYKYVEYFRNYNLKRNFNITSKEYDMMLINQDNKCLICGNDMSKYSKKFAVDHDHETGRVRGLLCSKCNGNLGWFEINKDKIIKYLDN